MSNVPHSGPPSWILLTRPASTPLNPVEEGRWSHQTPIPPHPPIFNKVRRGRSVMHLYSKSSQNCTPEGSTAQPDRRLDRSVWRQNEILKLGHVKVGALIKAFFKSWNARSCSYPHAQRRFVRSSRINGSVVEVQSDRWRREDRGQGLSGVTS